MTYTQPTFDALLAEMPAHAAAVAKQAQRDAAKMLKHDTKRVNEVLYKMGRTYHASVPLDLVNALLEYNGFTALEAMILCGRDGQLHESVGRNRWLALSWHRMPSGRYEVVAYLS
jgi:hypothetical protein